MIRALSGTVLAKATVAILNLLIIALAGRSMGAEGVGTITLIVLGITIIMLLNNLVGGGALTYLAPRHAVRSMLVPTYGWAFLTAGIALLVTRFLPLVPAGYEVHVCALAFIESLFSIHLNILLGKKRLKVFNWLTALQVVILFCVFYLLTALSDNPTPMDYVVASYAAFGATLLGSAIALSTHLKDKGRNEDQLLKKLITQGGFIQLANVFQLLNYRLSYYIIQHFSGIGPLGIYSVSSQLSEGSWMIPKSIGTILYMKVSNEESEERRSSVTIDLMHLSMLSAMVVLFVLWQIPDDMYRWAFGNEIIGIPDLVRTLSPGIVCMAGAQALSHYFSGIGRNAQNTLASGLGLVVTIGLALILIPRMGLEGAAIAASVAYSALYLYQLVAFKRISNVNLDRLIPDIPNIRRTLKEM